MKKLGLSNKVMGEPERPTGRPGDRGNAGMGCGERNTPFDIESMSVLNSEDETISQSEAERKRKPKRLRIPGGSPPLKFQFKAPPTAGGLR